jgi:Big-like domain-containing protein
MTHWIRTAAFTAVALACVTPAWAGIAIKVAPASPVSGTVTITATATGFPRLGEVRVLVDGVRVGSCTVSPCTTRWDSDSVRDGTHTIRVQVFNARRNLRASRSTSVVVAHPPEDPGDPDDPGDPPVPGDPGPAGPGRPTIAGCPVFPANNPWNTDVSSWPVHPNSANFIASIGSGNLHPDFGDIYGIPYTTVPGTQPRVPVAFYYGDESDPGPYPIPPDAPVEGGSDRHVLVLDGDRCVLYEMYDAEHAGPGWSGGSGAVWDLTINDTRPAGWTSADAAGLPILPGLVRYDEVVLKGEMNHAVRFTVRNTQRGYIAPASHWASSSTNPNFPPMGLRLRLKAGFDISRFHPQIQVILRALKTYGMIVADNGSNWFITGELNRNWNNAILNQLKTVPGSSFEVVDTGPIVTR